MDYNNKERVKEPLSYARAYEKELEDLKKAASDNAYYDVDVVISDRCNGDKILRYPAEGELRKSLLNKKIEETQGKIDEMIKELEQL